MSALKVTFNDIKSNEAVKTYIAQADTALSALGFTEHSFAHVNHVAECAQYILATLGYSDHEVELAKIASYLHDIGNLVNRVEHSQSGAVMAFRILDNLGMDPQDIATVVGAIGNHDEGTGVAANAVSAALIIADKTDVRRSRVRNRDIATFDIHDRVNYSVESSELIINEEKTTITLCLRINTEISAIMNYFEIFLDRMLLCNKAAKRLGLDFKLMINDQQFI